MNSDRKYLDRPLADWLRLLESDDPIDRRLGIYAVGELGPLTPDLADLLVAALDDPVSYVRVWAAASLAQVSPGRADTIATLVNASEEEMPFVRSLVAWHLGRLGATFHGIETSLPALKRLLDDDDANVRQEAARALERLRPDTDATGTWG